MPHPFSSRKFYQNLSFDTCSTANDINIEFISNLGGNRYLLNKYNHNLI